MRALALTTLLALLAAGLDAGGRIRVRRRDDARHRRSAAVMGPELALRRSTGPARHPGREPLRRTLTLGPGVADADPRALGARPW